jgi:hypothetical protein
METMTERGDEEERRFHDGPITVLIVERERVLKWLLTYAHVNASTTPHLTFETKVVAR